MQFVRVVGLACVLAGCVAPDDFPSGSWRLAEWSVEVGDPAAPEFTQTLLDAGFAEFEGDGTWWESVAIVELPLYTEHPEPQVVPQLGWVYWTYQRPAIGTGREEPELWLAWYQAYETPRGVIVLSERSDDRMVGDAAYSLGSSSVGLTDVRTHWVFEREDP